MSVMDGLISLHYSFFLIQQRHNVTLTVAVFFKCGTTVQAKKQTTSISHVNCSAVNAELAEVWHQKIVSQQSVFHVLIANHKSGLFKFMGQLGKDFGQLLVIQACPRFFSLVWSP